MSDGSLSGACVVVTRPRERAEALCFLLEEEGAQVLVMPALELLPPQDERPLQAAAEQLSRFDWIVLASPAAASALSEAARQAGTRDALRKAKTAVVGETTARAAEQLGFRTHLVASESRGEALAAQLAGSVSPQSEILLPTAETARPELEAGLRGAGLRVARVVAYRAEATSFSPEALAQLQAQPVDIVIFASPRSAEAFLEGGGEVARGVLQSATRVAIGPTTATALEGLGCPAAQVASEPSPPGLLEATKRAWAARSGKLPT
ncbi:MAG: uroporphyrinogen-III synthase [Myxococcaceae bacterium]